MARIELASLGAGVAQNPAGAVVPAAAGTIVVHNTATPVTIYATETAPTGNTAGTFITNSFGQIPGWIDPSTISGAVIDITILPAAPVTVLLSDVAGTAASLTSAEATRAGAAEALLIPLSQKGAANGVASLDGTAKLPSGQLPASGVSASSLATAAGQIPLSSGAGSNAAAWSGPGAVATRSGSLALRDFPHVKDYGAKGGAKSFASASFSYSTGTWTDSTNAPFSAGDVGKVIVLPGGGSNGRNFATTITAFQNSGQVTLAAAPPNAGGITGTYQYGWDDTTAIQAALNSGAGIRFDGDNYMWTSVAPTPGNIAWGYGVNAYKIPYCTTLSAGLTTGGPITSLPVNPLPNPLLVGQSVVTCSGTNAQAWLVTANAAVGATSVSVSSATPNFAYPSGSQAQTAVCAMFDALVGSARTTLSDGLTLFSGVKILGFNATGEGTAGYTIADAYRQDFVFLQQWSDIEVRDCWITGFQDAGITLRSCQRMWIEDNKLTNICLAAGRNAIFIGDTTPGTNAVATTGVFIRANYIDPCPTSPINVQCHWTNQTTPSNLVITGNITYCTSWANISVEIGNAGARVQQAVIADNICIGQAGTPGYNFGIYVQDDGAATSDITKTQDYIITGNYVAGLFGGAGICFYGNRAVIAHNIIVNTTTGTGDCIQVSQAPTALGSQNIIVSENIAQQTSTATQPAIQVQFLTHAKIRGNLVLGSATGAATAYGIQVGASCQFIDIEGNRIEGASGTGIYLASMADCKVDGNVVYNPNAVNSASSSQGVGIYVLNTGVGGTQNVIQGNIVYDDRGTHQMQYGLVLASAAAVKLLNNVITGAVNAPVNSGANWSRVRGNETDRPQSFPAAPSTPALTSGSPFTNSTGYDLECHVYGGAAVTALTYTRNGGSAQAIYAGSGAVGGITVTLLPGDALTPTFTSTAPTLLIIPRP